MSGWNVGRMREPGFTPLFKTNLFTVLIKYMYLYILISNQLQEWKVNGVCYLSIRIYHSFSKHTLIQFYYGKST